MNKLLKIVIGLTLALAMVVGVGALSASAATAPAQPLQHGDSGASVYQLQSALLSLGYSIPAGPTEYFGDQTKAAVVAFQNNYASEVLAPIGLSFGTGYYGPLTAAKLAAVLAGGPVVGSYPAGCTSSAGFSTTTGMPCSGPSNLPAGCTSTVGYSPTTGVKCDGSSTTSGSTTLSGGAGSVEEYKLLSSPSNNREVGEDQNDVKVLGMSIEADSGSDLAITAVKLNFTQVLANRDLEKYASDVSVWLGSTEVARVDADEFTDDNNFDKTISLQSGAIIKAGAVGNLYVALSGVSNLDSADDGETWTIDIDSVRFVDAQGAVISEDPGIVARTFTAELFASATDTELRLTENSGNPDTQVVEVSDTGTTDGVLLNKSTLKAQGSDIDVREMTFTVTPAGTGDASEIASQYILKINGNEVQSLDSTDCTVPGDCDGTGTATAVMYVFDDVDHLLSAGSTATVELVADINQIGTGGFAEGDSLVATINNDDTIAEDESGEDLLPADLTGTVNGRVQAFQSEGIMVKVTSATTNVTSDGDGATFVDTVQFSWTLDITTFGDNAVYINRDNLNIVAAATAGDDDAEVGYTIEYSGGAALTGVGGTSSESDADVDSTIVGDTGAYGGVYSGETFYKINQSSTGTITINVFGTNATNAKQLRAYLDAIEWTTDFVDDASGGSDALVDDVNDYIFDIADVSKTPYKTAS